MGIDILVPTLSKPGLLPDPLIANHIIIFLQSIKCCLSLEKIRREVWCVKCCKICLPSNLSQLSFIEDQQSYIIFFAFKYFYERLLNVWQTMWVHSWFITISLPKIMCLYFCPPTWATFNMQKISLCVINKAVYEWPTRFLCDLLAQWQCGRHGASLSSELADFE